MPRRLLNWASAVDDKDTEKRIANSEPCVGQSKRTGAAVREWGDDGKCCRQAGVLGRWSQRAHASIEHMPRPSMKFKVGVNSAKREGMIDDCGLHNVEPGYIDYRLSIIELTMATQTGKAG